jgi:hypothetical protein
MRTGTNTESRAMARLIAQIDSLDKLRDQVGRRVIALFLITFAIALSLLVYVALEGGETRTPGAARPEASQAPRTR